MAYSDVVIGDNPRAYWRLDETSGTNVNDLTSNNLDGTYIGSPTLGVAGANTGNTAVTFNGSSQYITVPDNNLLDITNDWAVEFWIKFSTLPSGNQTIISKGSDSYSVIITGAREFRLTKQGTGTIITSTATITDNDWHHVIITKNDTINAKIFIDGVDVSGTHTSQGNFLANTSNVYIATAHNQANYLNATLDEVALYSQFVGITLAQSHYNARLTTVTHTKNITASNSSSFSFVRQIEKTQLFSSTSTQNIFKELPKELSILSDSVFNFTKSIAREKIVDIASNHNIELDRFSNFLKSIDFSSEHTLSLESLRTVIKSMLISSPHDISIFREFDKDISILNSSQIRLNRSITKDISIVSDYVTDIISGLLLYKYIDITSTSESFLVNTIGKNIVVETSSDLITEIQKTINKFIEIDTEHNIQLNRNIDIEILFASSSDLSIITLLGRTFIQIIEITQESIFDISKAISKHIPIESISETSISRTFNKLIQFSSVGKVFLKVGDDYIINIFITTPSNFILENFTTFVKNINIVSNSQIIDPIYIKRTMIKLINKIGV